MVESLVNAESFFAAEKLVHNDLPAVRREVWLSPATMREFKAKTEELVQSVEAMRDAAKKRDESYRLGCALWILARYEEALAAFEEVKTRKGVLWLMGKCYAAADRWADARDALGRVASGGDAELELELDLASATRACGDIEAAQKLLDRYADQGEAVADYHYEKARCLEDIGNRNEAVELYERALALEPECAKAAFRLGYLHDLYGDDDRALAYYEQCVAIEPKHTNALLNLGILYEDMGQDRKALECFHQVVSAIPTHAKAQLLHRDVRSVETEYRDEAVEKRAGKRRAMLDTPVTDFELSVRSRNCLEKMNIASLGDLTRLTEQELLAYKNFGETSLNEIKAILAQHGLRLGQAIEEGEVSAAGEPEDEPDALATPLADMDFSARCRRCFERLNVTTLGDLAKHSKRELLDCPNLGQTSLQEIIDNLAEQGLSLREDK